MYKKLFKVWYSREKYIRKYTGRSEFAVYTELCWCFIETETPSEAILYIILREGTPSKSGYYNILYDFKVDEPMELK